MKRINRDIRLTIIKMILIIVLVVVSGLNWNKLNISQYEIYAEKSLAASTNVVSVRADNGIILNVFDKEIETDELNEIEVSVQNQQVLNERYEIALKADKSFPYEKIQIVIDGNQYDLESLYSYNNDTYNYFTLAEGLKSSEYKISFHIKKDDLKYYDYNDYKLSFVDLIGERV